MANEVKELARETAHATEDNEAISREAAQQSGTAVDGLGNMASELQEIVSYYKIA